MFGSAQLHFHGIDDLSERGRLVSVIVRLALSGLFHSLPRRMDAYPQGVSVLLVCGHRVILPTHGVRVQRQGDELWADQTLPLDPPSADSGVAWEGLTRVEVSS